MKLLDFYLEFPSNLDTPLGQRICRVSLFRTTKTPISSFLPLKRSRTKTCVRNKNGAQGDHVRASTSHQMWGTGNDDLYNNLNELPRDCFTCVLSRCTPGTYSTARDRSLDRLLLIHQTRKTLYKVAVMKSSASSLSSTCASSFYYYYCRYYLHTPSSPASFSSSPFTLTVYRNIQMEGSRARSRE